MKRYTAPVSLLLFFTLLTGLFSFASAAGSAPVAENLELSTYRGVSVGGQLSAAGTEDALRFYVVTQPVKGKVEVEENGRFVYDVMLENSPPALQYELDCFWAQVGGQNVTDRIRSLKGRMDVIHFKDMAVGSWDGFRMCPIGDGSMDYLSIMAASDEIGVKYAFVEQDNAPESESGSVPCLLRSLEYLKANGGRF